MKKMILLLAVFLIAAPAWATVAVDCTTDGNEVTVTYDADDEPNLPRAFALNISLSGDANIVTLVPGSFKIGESTSGNKGFGIFPGSIVIDDTPGSSTYGQVLDDGTPIAPADDPCTVGQLGSGAITVEQASLYIGPQGKGQVNAPDSNGVLLKFTIDKPATVTIAKNARRGGVVKENPDENPNDTYSGCVAAAGLCVGDTYGNGGPVGRTGSLDGWVTIDDLNTLAGMLLEAKTDSESDLYTGYFYFQCPGDDSMDSYDTYGNGGVVGRAGSRDDWVTIDDLNALAGLLLEAKTNSGSSLYTGYFYYQCPNTFEGI